MKEPLPPTNQGWKHYTVGFCFSEDLRAVVLIKKAKPAWQKGKLNGVGGSFEAGEDCYACMEREFREETTLIQKDWDRFAVGYYDCHQGACAVHYLVSLRENMDVLPTMPVEQPYWISTVALPEFTNLIPNLAWLIPMATLRIMNPAWRENGTVQLFSGHELAPN